MAAAIPAPLAESARRGVQAVPQWGASTVPLNAYYAETSLPTRENHEANTASFAKLLKPLQLLG